MENLFTIIIADDHPMLLNGLFEQLVANGYDVIGQATNGMEALEIVLSKKPTLALLDIDMPMLTGFEVIKIAKEKNSQTKFIVLSFHKETEYITQARALNIDGYLLKEDSFFEIQRCIQGVLKGGTYFSSSFQQQELNSANAELRKISFLTASEKTILKLVAKQYSTQRIADHLHVSSRTVEKHRSNIISKLEIEGETNSLTNWAIANKKIILEI
ncbi:MAG: response regulator transcription factor [Maribacter sp.]|nr:response regulator transcription factor [Maribacter sp.]